MVLRRPIAVPRMPLRVPGVRPVIPGPVPMATRVVETIAFSASTPVGVKLPRDRVITQIGLLFEVVYDTDASVTVTQDPWYKMLGGVSIEGSVGKFVDVKDARLLHFRNQKDYAGTHHAPKLDITPSQTGLVAYVPLNLHFGNNPQSAFDLSAAIRAEDLSSLMLYVHWPAADRGGTGVTTGTTSLVRLMVWGVQNLTAAQKERIATPKISQVDWPIDAVYSDLGKEMALPTGYMLRRSLLMVLDNVAAPNDARADDRVSELAVLLPKQQGRTPYRSTWRQAKVHDLGRAGGEVAADDGTTLAAPTVDITPDLGIAQLDYREFTLAGVQRNPWGLDMRAAAEGDAKLAFSIAVGTGYIKRLDEQFVVP